ncbi:protein of unknown function [Cnuella takakiae]|uniref:FAS1 domain-containing protein n=1 Tax=Cnuella takakiae TaxID=1302690 RepID=A0A1M4UR27_9BACT|nr:fasciclin domain-containing protein [Cnuella takakiae]OLY92797.1 hypothetical protein BUE76_13545 [Cnuella takakiae]SHE59176.1 protein of unknown function [Cnuella takakiae]
MNNLLRAVGVMATSALLFTSCKKGAFNDYYERPAGLEAPIYQVLTAKGNFKTLLAVIDKSGYKGTLSSAGYWTLFAPNDAAFETYFKENNTSLLSFDSTKAQALVQYLLVYNAFDKNRIDDYQSNTGWVPDIAFRRRTAYYSGFYNDTTATGQVVKTIASNRNGAALPYVAGDNNNKYIPYFTDVYFSKKKLSQQDYTYFYPGASFTGFNVAGAAVVNKDITAENGVVHEINRVVAPLLSLEEFLRSKPEYSLFRSLYEKYMVTYQQNTDATRRFALLAKEPATVFVKTFSSLLAFSPNNENFSKLQDNDGQQDSWSMIVPRNEQLRSYIENVLLEYYGKDIRNLGQLPPAVISDFLNAHMWQTALWPTKFSTTPNFLGEEARFDPATNIADKRILSNGMFYGATRVQDANVFSSVYSRAYLDPKYTMMTRLLDADLKFTINSPNQKYTLFMMPDAVLRAAGYDYVPSINEWGYTPPATGIRTAGEAVRQRLLRMLNTSLVQTPKGELDNLGGAGTIAASNGEVIRFNANQVMSGGSMDAGQTIRVDSSRTVRNGKVYYLNGLLSFSETSIGTHIQRLGAATTSEFNFFWQYLLNSAASYNAATGEIIGTSAGSFYTVFVPNNNAIRQAVRDGVLPGTPSTGVPNFAPTLPADRDRVNRFILYHILNKRTVIPDGKESGGFETLLKNGAGDVLTVTVLSQPGAMILTDMNNRSTTVLVPQSNNLSNRTVIHLTNNYLRYTF